MMKGEGGDIMLSTAHVARLAGCSERAVRMGIQTCLNGGVWRGSRLESQYEKGKGRGGRICRVRLDSLPIDLQRKWGVEQIGASQGSDIVKVGVSHENSLVSDAQRAGLLEQWAAKKEAQKRAGTVRFGVLMDVLHLEEYGLSKSVAVETAARKNEVSESSIYKWFCRVKEWPREDWSMVLASNHRGRIKVEQISPEAWDYIKADYLRPEAPALTAVYERALRLGDAKGWHLPSYKTVLRRVNSIPEVVRVLSREGGRALEQMYPAQERDKSVFRAMEAVNADGHRFDVFVTWPDGEVCRPILVCWQDLFSGKLLSYRIAKTENADAIRLSFGDMIERFGVPSAAYLDNGRGFASKWMTGGMKTRYRFKIKPEEPAGILTQLGVDVHWCLPAHGQSKPIERAFRDLCEYVSKHPACAGAYTGNSPLAKPENHGARTMSLEQFKAVLDEEIKAHNSRSGRRSKVCSGRSFDEVFEESYRQYPLRPASEQHLLQCMLAAESVIPRRGSGEIQFGDNRYWCEELTNHRSSKLTVRFDPDNLHSAVWVYTLDGAFICKAPCIAATGFNDTQAAREHARQRNRFKRAAKEQLKAMHNMSALEATIPNVSVEQPDTIHIRMDAVSANESRAKTEPLNAERLITPLEPERRETAKAFSRRISTYVSGMRDGAASSSGERVVESAWKKLSRKEASI